MNHDRQTHDLEKLVQWPQHKVRWLIYYYLIGMIVALYVLFLNDWLLGWAWTWLAKFLFVIVICPVCVCVLSVFLKQKLRVRDLVP